LEDATQGVEQHAARAAEVAEGMREQGLVLPELDQQLQLAEQALHAAEARQQQLRVEQEQQQTMLDQLRSTEAHSRASLEFLVGLVDTTESSKFLMNSDEWKPSGEKLTLAEVLNTSDELRVAVEAALGDAARYFVVANRAEANQAIGALSRNNIGKATFLCRDAIPNLPEPPAINHEGGVRGWASELVLCDDALRGALRGILGRTVIAEDLEAAWQAVQGTQAERAVTLAGEVVHRAGAVRGGSTSRTEGVRVGRRERINQLRGELATLEQQVEQAVVTAQQLKDEYAGIDLRALGEVVRQATVSANAVQQRLESMRGRLADIEGTAAKLREEVEGCRVELEQLGVAQADTERQLAAIGEGVVAAEADVRSQEEQLIQAEAAAQEATARQREAEILVVRLDGELQSLQADEARLSDQNLTIDQRREQREQERTQLAQQLTSLSAEREQASRQASVLMQQVAAASAARQDAELTLQETVAATHAASEAVRAQRRAVEALVHEQHEADLKLNAAQLKIEQLERHAAEELELIRGSEFNAPGEGEVVAPSDTEGPDLVREQAQELRRKLTLMGNVNFLALEEHERENERFQFLSTQLADLTASEKTLAQTILEINQTARELFTSTFAQIRDNFTQLFKLLFSEDDEADLQMVETEDNDPLECKVEIIAKPRGKRPHGIEMLSGGEKTLTAIALLFAIYLVKPSPFCILDEVDAPLDDANIDRYLKIIRKFSENTQFLMITHNKRTMEAADTLYGVTMEEPAVSKVVSVQLGGERRSESAKEAA
jgi:chromosome segregation protein